MTFDLVIVSCEHAGALVPLRYRRLFDGQRAQRALGTHRGIDLGAHAVARALARRFEWPLHACRTTRLLVDVNRSVGHRQLFSEFSARLDHGERAQILTQFHAPHRHAIEARVAQATRRRQRVLHLSVHTFTPRLGHDVRRADVGLLYDPTRKGEAAFCAAWQSALQRQPQPLVVRRNYPYRGVADGLTTTLRRRFRAATYAGIELEVNQRLVSRPGPARTTTIGALGDGLHALCNWS